MPKFSADAYDRMQAIRRDVAQWCDRIGVSSESAKNANLVGTYLTVIEQLIDRCGVGTQSTNEAVAVLRAACTAIRASVEPDLYVIAEKVTEMDQSMLDRIGNAAERWRTWCRIMGGWQDPALRPHVSCPACGTVAGERAGLRVRVDAASGTGGIIGDAAVRAAVCLTCDATWDAGTVGLLGEQLRTGRAGLT
jgi:hypothetical protein